MRKISPPMLSNLGNRVNIDTTENSSMFFIDQIQCDLNTKPELLIKNFDKDKFLTERSESHDETPEVILLDNEEEKT
jgi:hypothetical protein